jgi:pimeloyl-ACP methyl ester carboxylesterase
VHGFGGNRSDEHILQTAPIYASRDYSVLILDLRGHGDSGGERRTLGTTKRRTYGPPSRGSKNLATNQTTFSCTAGRWAVRPWCGPRQTRT